MARSRRFHNTFITGQVSQALHERYDFDKREGALAVARNVRIRPQGGLVRRDGSRFVQLAKNSFERVRLVPFVFSRSQAYVLEFGELYVRFYRDGGRLVDGGGFAIEVVSPYTIDEVQEIDFSQDADTLVITHPTHQPRVLQRWSDTNWTLNFLNFRPPPTTEIGRSEASVTLTFVSISGNRYTVTATPSNIFTESDVGRLIRELGEDAQGVAVIDAVLSLTVCEVTVLQPFTKLVLDADPLGGPEWIMAGSPLANLSLKKTDDGEEGFGGKGELVSPVAYLRNLAGATNELSNGDFSSGLTGWTNYSGPLIYTGTHTGGGADNFITDSANTNMRAEGVELNHLMIDGTAGAPADIAYISQYSSSGTTGWDKLIPGNVDFKIANGNTFEIRDTSYVRTGADGGSLYSGPNGTAWIEQAFTAEQQAVYEYEITVREFSCSFQIGSVAKGSDVLDEVTLTAGITKVVFTTPNWSSATTMPLYVQFKNNQPETVAVIENVIIRQITVNAFGLNLEYQDWIRVNAGYIQVIATEAAGYRFKGVVEDVLDTVDDALPGAWSLERSKWFTNNYPANVTFFQGRLWFSQALTVWGSVLDNLNSFALGINDGDAIEFEPAATQLNPVHWMVGERQLLLGTLAEEYVVTGTETSFIKPTDIDVNSPTAIGSEAVKPLRVEQAVLFVKSGGRRLIEYSFSSQGTVDQYKDLSILVPDLISVGDKIVQIAYQDEPYQIVWCVTQNGLLLSLSYVKEHNIWAWATHDSADGALFESVTTIPHPDGDRDQVWVSVKRPWTTRSQVSYLDDELGLIPGLLSTTTDGTLRYTGAAATTLTGLNHLTGAQVYCVDSTGIQGPYEVIAGSVTLDRAVTQADVGVGVTLEIETLRPAIEGQGATGLIIGDTNMFIRVRNTGDGVTARGKLLKLRKPTDPMDGHITPVNGEIEIPSVGFNRDITVNIQQAIPASFELQSIAGTIQYENP